MKYGYARVSIDDQNPALQLAALKKAGCQTVHLRDREQGRCEPDQPSRAWLTVIAHDPEGVKRALSTKHF